MSEVLGHFPEAGSREVFIIDNAKLNAKVGSTIQRDFELLTTLGVRAPVCFGGALRDLDLGMVPNDYDFVGGLSGESFIHGVCRIVGRLSGELTDREITTVTNAATQTAQLLFNHMGRRIDLHLVSGKVPSVEEMADYGSIGLCSIAVGENGQVVASERYINDLNDRTLTIRPGLSEDEHRRAESRVVALRQRYPNFRPVSNSSAGAQRAAGRNAVLAYEG